MFKNSVHAKKENKKGLSRGLLTALLIGALMVSGISGCSSSDKSDSSVESTGESDTTNTPTGSNTLRVGVRDDIPGFGYYNDIAEKYTGLEVDLAKELASRLGYSTVQFFVTIPQTKEDQMIDEEVDCVIACYSITEQRKEVIDFSPSYYTDTSVVMVEQSSLFSNDIEDLKNCTFGIREGTNTGDQLVERLKEENFTDGILVSYDEDTETYYYDNFQIREYPTYQQVSDALERGDVDTFCADGCIIRAFSQDDRKTLDLIIGEQDYGVATKKGSELSEPIYEAIEQMNEDGTIAELIDRWD